MTTPKCLMHQVFDPIYTKFCIKFCVGGAYLMTVLFFLGFSLLAVYLIFYPTYLLALLGKTSKIFKVIPPLWDYLVLTGPPAGYSCDFCCIPSQAVRLLASSCSRLVCI